MGVFPDPEIYAIHETLFQANFAKDPSMPPAPNWPAFGPTNNGVAQLAFHGNVALENVVEVTNSSDMDPACQLINSITF